jgi:hypothetical protein
MNSNMYMPNLSIEQLVGSVDPNTLAIIKVVIKFNTLLAGKNYKTGRLIKKCIGGTYFKIKEELLTQLSNLGVTLNSEREIEQYIIDMNANYGHIINFIASLDDVRAGTTVPPNQVDNTRTNINTGANININIGTVWPNSQIINPQYQNYGMVPNNGQFTMPFNNTSPYILPNNTNICTFPNNNANSCSMPNNFTNNVGIPVHINNTPAIPIIEPDIVAYSIVKQMPILLTEKSSANLNEPAAIIADIEIAAISDSINFHKKFIQMNLAVDNIAEMSAEDYKKYALMFIYLFAEIPSVPTNNADNEELKNLIVELSQAVPIDEMQQLIITQAELCCLDDHVLPMLNIYFNKLPEPIPNENLEVVGTEICIPEKASVVKKRAPKNTKTPEELALKKANLIEKQANKKAKTTEELALKRAKLIEKQALKNAKAIEAQALAPTKCRSASTRSICKTTIQSIGENNYCDDPFA